MTVSYPEQTKHCLYLSFYAYRSIPGRQMTSGGHTRKLFLKSDQVINSGQTRQSVPCRGTVWEDFVGMTLIHLKCQKFTRCFISEWYQWLMSTCDLVDIMSPISKPLSLMCQALLSARLRLPSKRYRLLRTAYESLPLSPVCGGANKLITFTS